jgi:predicted metal-dependent phosphoesterase TrpH
MVAFDLQSHSTRSDGALEPAEVVARAAAEGVELLALSDHDTIEGVPQAQAAADEHGIRLTPATEISSVAGEHSDLHVVGYGVDVTDPALTQALEAWRADRHTRTEAIADRLEELGFAVDRTVLEERKAQGRPIGRPHIADAVLAHPDNQERLEQEGIEGKNDFFPAYIVPGAKAFVQRTVPTVQQAIETIQAAGGVAVWAHPFWDLADPDEVLRTIDGFKAQGLDGVEVFYPTHDERQTRLLHEHCTANGLLITGSSDFHAPDHDHFPGFLRYETFGLEPDLGPIGQ